MLRRRLESVSKQIMDIVQYNREAWNHQVEKQDQWTIPVSTKEIEEARNGKFNLLLTPTKPIPHNWIGNVKGLNVLCLASGGGQQVPIFAALGANVVSFDNSDKQLEQDEIICKKHQLDIKTIQGDMRNLSVFADESSDIIFNPCSTCFADDVIPVWNECFRVLRKGGILLTGFLNPMFYIFDQQAREKNILNVKYALPYSDIDSLTEIERRKYTDNNEPLVYSHTLTSQIGGQTQAGFHIIDLFEDNWNSDEIENNYFSSFIATKAIKPII